MAIELARIGKLHVGLLGVTGGVAYATQWIEPGSLLLGGAVMGVNVWLLRLITDVLRTDLFDPAKRGRVAVAVAAMVLKFAVFLGLLIALFGRVPIAGMSFALGVTLFLVACLLEVAWHESSAPRAV
jgi:hypothetical protein